MKRDDIDNPALIWPSGGFQWKPDLRRQLPVVRGIHAPPLEPLGAAPPLRAGGYHAGHNVLAGCFGSATWQYWVTSPSDLPGEHLALAADAAVCEESAWLELLAQAAGSAMVDFQKLSHHRSIDKAGKQRAKPGDASALNWVTRQCLERNGLPFTLRLALELWHLSASAHPGYSPAQSWREAWQRELLAPLRQAIACAPDALHEEALGIAAAACVHPADMLRVRAHLFPHRPEWALQWLALNESDGREWLVASCALPAAAFVAYLERHPHAMSLTHAARRIPEAALLLQCHLHGEAAFPALALLTNRAMARDESAEMMCVLGLLTRMYVPEMPRLLAGHLALRKVRVALERLAGRFPAAVLLAAIEHTLASRSRAAEGWTIRLALQRPGALPAALAALEPARRARFEAVLAALNREPAPLHALPALLREPPWLRVNRPTSLPQLDVPVMATPERIVWPPERLELARADAARDWRGRSAGELNDFGFPKALHLLPAAAQRLLAGGSLQAGDVGPGAAAGVSPEHVLASPPHTQVALWNSYPAGWVRDSHWCNPILTLLCIHCTAVIPGCVRHLSTHAGKNPWLALMLDTPGLVAPMLHVLRNVRLHRPTAMQWLKDFARTALYSALPQAFAPAHSAARDDARHGIRWLVSQGFEEEARAAAQAYGGLMPAALQALIASDPLDAVPGEMPALPAFFVPQALRRPELRTGGVLPISAMTHIAHMLMIGLPDAPYAGIALVKEACTPASLAEFAWDIYEAWMAAEAPASGRWAFGALAQLGDAETARRLATRIRAWAGEPGMRGRATDALDLLAAMGSDAALMRIQAIATKGSHNRTREHAGGIIEAIARARGLDREALEDRLAPTLDLDEPNATTLDFGPRQFFLDFDEGLRPRLCDARGQRLKDLPKPNKSDDPKLASGAAERFKLLRREAKAMASLQITRLERAMVKRRRWPAAEFRQFFVEHPVLRHLAARIVWARYDGERLAQPFRLAEDWTLASVADERFELAEDAVVGIPHVLELPDEQLPALHQLLADYEIVQPFRQLMRETYALMPDERGRGKLERFLGRDAATGALIGLTQKGWERGEPQDDGMIGEFWREAPGGLMVSIAISPGIFVAGHEHEPRQMLDMLWVNSAAQDATPGAASFDQLDPIFLSEVLRDLELLAPAKD